MELGVYLILPAKAFCFAMAWRVRNASVVVLLLPREAKYSE